ncbi:MAG: hypothetical protein RLZZ501_2303 [Pseudomonadota bacterium]|jgi:hypothetical protein
MARWRNLMVAAVVLAVAACSDKPGSGAVEDAVRQQLQDNELLRYDSIKQSNGYKTDDSHYTAIVEYDIVFNKSYQDYVEDVLHPAKPNDAGEALQSLATMIGGPIVVRQTYGDFSKGERRHIVNREYKFLKTDKGWLLRPEE